MADIFDVVADATRRELMAALLERHEAGWAAGADGKDRGEISVGDLVEHLGLSQPTVSKHLRVLRDHDLVTVREEGQHRYYRLNAGPLEDIEAWVEPFLFSADQEAADGEVVAPAFTAWAGADVGENLGRAVANVVSRTLPASARRRLFGDH